ncbi:MAG: DNA replication/repair protein RecF [Christensenellaceae bacterium]
MIIKKLTLNNFRNYVSETYEYSPGLNVVVGPNAQGKTNSAEAIFLLCTGYSPRMKRDKQVIRYGESMANIAVEATALYGDINVDMTFSESGKKRIRINGVAISKVGELLGNVNAVFFNPGELKLIQESPEDRRRFLDISLSQMNKRYFYALKRYNEVLMRRNSLLKNDNRDLILDTIRLWDEQLVENAKVIITERNKFIKLLQPYCKEAHSFITQGEEELAVEPSLCYGDDEEEIVLSLTNGLIERLEKDIILGYTTFGPHRDDLKITLNGEDVKTFGSQGQARTCALSLKLAELEIFNKRFGEYPLLILDDALSELDVSRQKRLIERIKNIQTIITLTKIDEDVFGNEKYKRFDVLSGKII